MHKNFKGAVFFFFLISGVIFFIFLAIQDYVFKKENASNLNRIKFVAPLIVRAVYLTNYSAASESKIAEVIEMAKNKEINAVVIDIKDWSGYIDYDTKIPQAEQYQSKRVLIKDLSGLAERLHQNNIYVIARIAVFQDPVFTQARPELSVQRRSKKGSLWFDYHGLAWLDPASPEVWNYHAALARDVLDNGFDEINFDYVRFPSDGNLDEMHFPVWDKKITKSEVIKTFFKYLRWYLPQAKLSVDLFGYTTVNQDDLGIGQVIENAFPYLDFICPMVYPSHYNPGFLGYENPAQHPYQVIKHSMEAAQKRLMLFNQNQKELAKVKLRPWLQDFSLGAEYNAAMVKEEIKAVEEALGENYNGFILWNARNVYTRSALTNN